MTETLPSSSYSGDARHRAERDGIFATAWLFVAHEADLPRPGAYLAGVVGGFPVVVLRHEDGSVRGYHNVCPHRAGPLVGDGTGSAGTLVCRYHGWSFDTSGALKGARDFGGEAPEGCRLFDLRVDAWRGLVFCNVDGAAPSLAEALGSFGSLAEGFDLEAMVPAGQWHHDLACNWKTYAENYLEGYHIPVVHKELARTIDVRAYEVVARDDWCLHRAPARDGSVIDGRWMWRWPNLALNLYRSSMNVERFEPVDARTTRVTYRYFSLDGTLDEEVARISKLLLMEDAAICEAVQRNLDVGVYERGVLSPRHEQGVALFQRLVRERVKPAD